MYGPGPQCPVYIIMEMFLLPPLSPPSWVWEPVLGLSSERCVTNTKTHMYSVQHLQLYTWAMSKFSKESEASSECRHLHDEVG